MRLFVCLLVAAILFCTSLTGCGGGSSPTVKPADAEKVAPDAPVGEEKPSTDEK